MHNSQHPSNIHPIHNWLTSALFIDDKTIFKLTSSLLSQPSSNVDASLLSQIYAPGEFAEGHVISSRKCYRSVLSLFLLLRQSLVIFVFGNSSAWTTQERSITSHDPQVSIMSPFLLHPRVPLLSDNGEHAPLISGERLRRLEGTSLRGPSRDGRRDEIERARGCGAAPCVLVPLVRNQLRTEPTLASVLAQSSS